MDPENSQDITPLESTEPYIAGAGPRGSEIAVEIPTSKIRPNPDQPREHFDELEHKWLTESIAKNGVLQPILVRPLDDGDFMIIAGERRYRAAEAAGLPCIPAVVANRETRPLAELDVQRLALIENLQRSNLNDYELAVGITEYLRKKLDFDSVDDVCRFLRRMRNETLASDEADRAERVKAIFRELGRQLNSFTANQLIVFSLHPEVLKQLRLGKLDLSKARALNGIKEDDLRRHMMWNAIAQGWSTAQLRREIADLDKRENRTLEQEQRRVAIASGMTDIRKAYVKRRRLLSPEELSRIEELIASIRGIVMPSKDHGEDEGGEPMAA